MELDEERFKKMFPNLAKEFKKQKVDLSLLLDETEKTSKRFIGYTPDVIDFIRRCDNKQQAEKIINYLENRGEISSEFARRLRRQLKEKGVRSFGVKKEEDYYLKQGGL